MLVFHHIVHSYSKHKPALCAKKEVKQKTREMSMSRIPIPLRRHIHTRPAEIAMHTLFHGLCVSLCRPEHCAEELESFLRYAEVLVYLFFVGDVAGE